MTESRDAVGGRFDHVRRWVLIASLPMALVVGLLSWLHYEQRHSLQQASRQLAELRQARIELTKGFLQICLGSASDAPFRREEGIALIEQSVHSFERSLQSTSDMDPDEAQAFRRSAGGFIDLLGDRRPGQESDAGRLVALRIAFSDLERRTNRVDAASQLRVVELEARNERAFVVSLGGSLLALATILLIVVLISRKERQAVVVGEARFRQLFEEAPIALATSDISGRILMLNLRFVELFGYQAHELRSLDDWQRQVLADERVASLLAGEPLASPVGAEADALPQLETRLVCKDGSYKSVLLRRLCLNETVLLVIVDITARQQAEEEVRRLNCELEQRVAVRTAELSASNQELDAFAYAVSHDLRAPLRAMNGFSEALLEDCGGELSEEARGYLEQIRLAERRMGELIDGILALSRSTRRELQGAQVDLSRLARQRIDELRRLEPQRPVQACIEEGLVAWGDARMLESALGNLIDNAWKYSAKVEAAQIRVFRGQIEGQPAFCVSDNGAGFDMAHAQRLFKPFQRLHRQDEFPGIGVGLATVQRIIRRHGGTIVAVGSPGAGATFCFTLPDTAAEEG